MIFSQFFNTPFKEGALAVGKRFYPKRRGPPPLEADSTGAIVPKLTKNPIFFQKWPKIILKVFQALFEPISGSFFCQMYFWQDENPFWQKKWPGPEMPLHGRG